MSRIFLNPNKYQDIYFNANLVGNLSLLDADDPAPLNPPYEQVCVFALSISMCFTLTRYNLVMSKFPT